MGSAPAEAYALRTGEGRGFGCALHLLCVGFSYGGVTVFWVWLTMALRWRDLELFDGFGLA